MAKVKVYNQKGEAIKTLELNDQVFGVPMKVELIWQAVVAQLANARQNIAHTKGRSEVRGGGKKPWRQKGTGRARHGSIRSPIWIGGGVTFGPTKNRNFSKSINKKVRRKALLVALSDKAANNNVVVVDTFNLDKIKTKEMYAILHNLKLRTTKKKTAKKEETKVKQDTDAKKVKKAKAVKVKDASILIVLDGNDKKVIASANNLPRVATIQADSLNVYDVVKHQKLLLTAKSLDVITKVYSQPVEPARMAMPTLPTGQAGDRPVGGVKAKAKAKV